MRWIAAPGGFLEVSVNAQAKLLVLLAVFAALGCAKAQPENRQSTIRDIATVEGVRENPLLGYGIVVGLKGTGDSRQTIFTIQTLANALQRMGVQIPPGSARSNNVAAVFVTASLPPFARPGTALDITVSSAGDAKSLEGGMLLLTALSAADGKVYAAAQGPLTIGGYSAGGGGNGRQVNHPTVGRIAGGDWSNGPGRSRCAISQNLRYCCGNPALEPQPKWRRRSIMSFRTRLPRPPTTGASRSIPRPPSPRISPN